MELTLLWYSLICFCILVFILSLITLPSVYGVESIEDKLDKLIELQKESIKLQKLQNQGNQYILDALNYGNELLYGIGQVLSAIYKTGMVIRI